MKPARTETISGCIVWVTAVGVKGFKPQCLDNHGKVVKTDPVVYSFLWVGIIATIGFVMTDILAFAFAAPAGLLFAIKTINTF